MKFISNLDEKKYEEFLKTFSHAHFLQSSKWAKFKSKSGTKYILVGLEDNGKLVAVASLLKKELYLGYSYFYAPRAFMIDFNNYEYLEFFTRELKKFLKKEKAIFLKIDPAIIISYTKDIDKDEEILIDYSDLFAKLKELGYKHQGFNELFESSQPRYTFRIDLEKDVEANFSKTLKKRIKKAENYLIETVEGDESDLKDFYRLMKLTEVSKDFVQDHNLKYYEDLFSIFKDNIRLFKAYVYPEKVIKENEKKVSELGEKIREIKEHKNYSDKKIKELEKQKENSLKIIEEYQKALKEHGKKILLNIHILIYYKDTCWALYAGNERILLDSCSNSLLYKHHILDAKEKGYKIYDNFGAVSKNKKDHPLYGLNLLKKSFNSFYQITTASSTN